MKNKKKRMIQYVACVCFTISAVMNVPYIVELFGLIGFVSKNGMLGMILAMFLISLEIIGKVLVVISIELLLSNMAIVGSVMSFVSLLIRGVQCKFTVFGETGAEYWTSGLFWTIFWAIMAISMLPCLNKKSARKLCFAAGFVELIHLGIILPEQMTLLDRYGWSFVRDCSTYTVNFDLLPVLVLAIGAILLGMILPEMTEKPKEKEVAAKQVQIGAENKLVQLEKLNGLLEKGYITKEEFDTKKEQIMKY